MQQKAEASLTIAWLRPMSTLPLICWLHHDDIRLAWQLNSFSSVSHVCPAGSKCIAEQDAALREELGCTVIIS